MLTFKSFHPSAQEVAAPFAGSDLLTDECLSSARPISSSALLGTLRLSERTRRHFTRYSLLKAFSPMI